MGSILVTGGAGFVGSNLVARLLEENEVILFDNLFREGTEKNLAWLEGMKSKNLKVLKEDVRDLEALKKACSGVDVICHLAAQVAVTTSVEDPRTDYDINSTGTFNVLEAARLSESDPIVLFTSTNKVYGALKDIELEEREKRYDFRHLKEGVPSERPIEPYTPYGCSKAAGDSYCLDYNRIYGLRTVVFRMSCIYGPRQFGNEDQGWVAHFLITHALGKPLTIYGDGKQVRDILYVDDLVDAILSATKNIEKTKGQAYSIGGGPKNVISLLELVEHVEKKCGKKYELDFGEWRPADQKVYYSDISKATLDFGWEPRVPAKEGIDRLYAYIEENISLFR